jgi:hypothetical protein
MRPVFGQLRAIRHNFRAAAAFLWAGGGKVGIAGVRVTPRLPRMPKWPAKFSEGRRDLPLFRAARACLRRRQKKVGEARRDPIQRNELAGA